MEIKKTKYWTIKLHPDQAYLGRCLIILNRDAPSLSEVNEDEYSEFHIIVKKMEGAFKKSFGAIMFNWTCLMNNAFKAERPKPHVHWHCRPRYNKKVEFAGEVFEDLEFACHYSVEREKKVSANLLKKIADKVRENL